jgi:putative DNA primase/helicase
LPQKLKEQASGVLNWIVRGAWEWANSEDGLVAPKAVTDATEEYRSDMDRIRQFLEEACDTGPAYQVPLNELYQGYSNWVTADDNTEMVEGKIRFGQRLESKGFKKERTNDKKRVRVWQGVRLKPGY